MLEVNRAILCQYVEQIQFKISKHNLELCLAAQKTGDQIWGASYGGGSGWAYFALIEIKITRMLFLVKKSGQDR